MTEPSFESRLVKIADIKAPMRGVVIVGRVTGKSDPYEINTRFGPAMISDAELEDGTGRIRWRIWRDQIPRVSVGDEVKLQNAFVRSFGAQLELNLGSDGILEIVQKPKSA